MRILVPTVTLRAMLLILIGTIAGCGKKEMVSLPPVKVNVVKAVQNDVPLYEDFVAQVYG